MNILEKLFDGIMFLNIGYIFFERFNRLKFVILEEFI